MGSIESFARIVPAFSESDHIILKKRLPAVLEGDWSNTKLEIKLPRGARILKVDNQKEYPTIWFLTSFPFEEIPLVKRNIYMFETGQVISKDLERMSYIGTVSFYQGSLVYHFYTGYEEGTRFGL